MSVRPSTVPVSPEAADRGALVTRIWRAPATDQTAVIEPPWSQAPSVALANAERLARLPGEMQGQAWSTLRAAARSECLAAAQDYLRQLNYPLPASSSSGPLIVGGHQPELFHSGVWAKNFAVHALARHTGGVGLHLIVDHDACQRSAIRVPAGDAINPRREWLPFDAPQPTQPWEELSIADRALFDSFGDRVATSLQPWSISPIVADIWPHAVAAAEAGAGLADALTVARVAAERRWGQGNLELPLSRLSALPSFLWFVAGVLARAAEFARHHNAILADYRRLNRVRSRAHPVPELAMTADGWIEVPFWIWRHGDTRRERLFVQPQGSELKLRRGNDVCLTASLAPERSAEAAVAQLSTLRDFGWRLRPRALTTTLFARLCLADLFVHGLGGAKYDEMTDALMARFFHIPPPDFLTVTATLHLPLGVQKTVTVDDIGQLKHALWDLDHNPQRCLASSTVAEVVALIAERQQLIRTVLTTADHSGQPARRTAYRRVHEITATLVARLSDERRQLQDELARAEHRQAAERILASREYSWTLFPADLLRSYYAQLFDPK